MPADRVAKLITAYDQTIREHEFFRDISAS
jgi:hypothetical protein